MLSVILLFPLKLLAKGLLRLFSGIAYVIAAFFLVWTLIFPILLICCIIGGIVFITGLFMLRDGMCEAVSNCLQIGGVMFFVPIVLVLASSFVSSTMMILKGKLINLSDRVVLIP